MKSLRSSKRMADSSAADEIKNLEKENERLRLLLAERASHGATKSGYLYKFRPHAESSLWANTWEVRYVILRGQEQELTYYRSERDVAYPPRGQISLQGTYVDMEGLKRRRFWTFRVVDRQGVDLVRLSTEVQSDYHAWVEALERAGCKRRGDDDSYRALSPAPSSSQLSPTASGVSDDTATSGRQGRGYEVDSTSRPQPSGYTSDQSDVAHRPRPRRNRPDSGRSVGNDTCAPVHTQPRFSLLSSERINVSNQSGLLTLMFIVVAATNFRLILENMIKYGLRFNPFTFVKEAVTPKGNTMLLLCWPSLALFTLAALGIEKIAANFLMSELKLLETSNKKRDREGSPRLRRSMALQARIAEGFILLLNIANTTAALMGPFYVIHVTNAEPLPAMILTMVTCIVWLKLVSYHHVNWALRKHRRRDPNARLPGETMSGSEPQGVDIDVMAYPVNLSFNNLAYFMAAPTLCYQMSYPRSPRFRIRWALRRIFMLCGALALMLFIMEQYIEPTIDNSLKPLQEMDWLRMVERVLKLSIPTLYFWLAMFYALFELWLNVLAEFTRFGDREFYKEWWNATTLGEYWRLWNMPVHKWMLRHVYFPSLRAGMPKFAAGVVVFFISAVFHEVLVGVPLHMLRGWAFWGIMAQVPLMWVTELLKRKFKSDRVGNAIFWVSFCFLGQPLAQILYVHDWFKNQSLNPPPP